MESVMQTQAVDGKLFWPTMSAVGAEVLRIQREDTDSAMFDHVVVDEAQNFNAGHRRFLRACVDPATQYITKWQDLSEIKNPRIGVMCRTRGQLSRIVAGLADHGIDAVQTKNATQPPSDKVTVMTMHGAKGMEFTHAILMGVGRDILPQRFRLAGLSEADKAATLQQERSLLYVAASRARDALVITTVGERSELLPEV